MEISALPKKVLILDANQRSALAATRSLGRRGIQVIVAEDAPSTLAGASKYCDQKIVYPSPLKRPDDFLDFLQEECRKCQIAVLLPMTEITTHLILRHRDQFPNVSIPFASFEKFDALTNKWNLFKMATALRVPVPNTIYIEDLAQLEDVIPNLHFPIVLKPFRSRILESGTWVSTAVTYARNREDLMGLVFNPVFSQHPFLIQDYIKGHGCGVFMLYNQGRQVAIFAHRRLREKPPSGGVSVLSESVAPDPQAVASAKTILDHMGWHGLAMVEFKRDESGTPYLMEINARFWGSLQLAIHAGVDFPWLLYQLATGKTLTPVSEYEKGIKTRWLLGDLDSLYLSCRNKKLHIGEKARKLGRFCRFFEKGLHYEVNQWQDLSPAILELKNYVRDLTR